MTCVECETWDCQDLTIECEGIEPHSLTGGNRQNVGVSLRYYGIYECTECGRIVEFSGIVSCQGDSFA